MAIYLKMSSVSIFHRDMGSSHAIACKPNKFEDTEASKKTKGKNRSDRLNEIDRRIPPVSVPQIRSLHLRLSG